MHTAIPIYNVGFSKADFLCPPQTARLQRKSPIIGAIERTFHTVEAATIDIESVLKPKSIVLSAHNVQWPP